MWTLWLTPVLLLLQSTPGVSASRLYVSERASWYGIAKATQYVYVDKKPPWIRMQIIPTVAPTSKKRGRSVRQLRASMRRPYHAPQVGQSIFAACACGGLQTTRYLAAAIAERHIATKRVDIVAVSVRWYRVTNEMATADRKNKQHFRATSCIHLFTPQRAAAAGRSVARPTLAGAGKTRFQTEFQTLRSVRYPVAAHTSPTSPRATSYA